MIGDAESAVAKDLAADEVGDRRNGRQDAGIPHIKALGGGGFGLDDLPLGLRPKQNCLHSGDQAAGLGLFDDSHFKGLPQALRCLLSEG